MAKAKETKREIPMRAGKPNVMGMVKEAVRFNKNVSDEDGVKWIKDTFDGFDDIDAEKFKANARGIRAQLGVITVKKRGSKNGSSSNNSSNVQTFDATFQLLSKVADFEEEYGAGSLAAALELINSYGGGAVESAIEFAKNYTKKKAA